MFLGHVQPASSALTWTVSDAAHAIPTMTNGHVLAVDGWLTSVMTSCGPAPFPFDPPVPNPFNCQPPGWIGSDDQAGEPKIDIQTFAYTEFASEPFLAGSESPPFKPRRGVYLVRWVEYEAANCHACRRFLVVGRMDASVGSPNDLAGAPLIRSAQELAADLATNRAAHIGHVVFVDGDIAPGQVTGSCAGAALCSIGTLAGADEPVRATPYTVSLTIPDPAYPLSGVLSLVVRPDGLEYLGGLALGFGQDLRATRSIQSLSDPMMLGGGSATVITHGWLVDTGVPCASAAPSDPPDLPFGPCATDWLTATAEPIGQGSSGAAGPPGGVRVQAGAYRTFAAKPHEAPGGGGAPQEGTYLLRQALLRPTEPDGPRGWQVVARLEP